MTDARILVVEDEVIARRVLRDMLVRAGYNVTAVGSGEEALEELEKEQFDVLLTDLKLRKVDGMQVISAARERDPDIETIVLTGYATLDSAVSAVRNGSFNYILKPGQPGEIESSVARALSRGRERRERTDNLRRMGESLLQLAGSRPSSEINTPPPNASYIIQAGGLRLDQQRHSATLNGKPLNLSPGEFALLTYLAQRPHQVISHQHLVQEVMGYRCDPHEARDLIKARIWALRRKLEADPANPQMLISVRGVGYMLSVEADSPHERTGKN
jgi:DNA-binding response OmpR family regulator